MSASVRRKTNCLLQQDEVSSQQRSQQLQGKLQDMIILELREDGYVYNTIIVYR